MTEDQIKQFKLQILATFKYTKQLLERHNLRYVGCGGSVLGAVRHNGFIPWDDDIDIYMPREDYNKLLLLDNEAQKDGYSIFSIENNPGYYNAWAKVVYNNSSLWEVKMHPFMIGAFVDIFPLDEFSGSDEEITAIQFKSDQLFNDYIKSIRDYNYTDLIKFFFNRNRTDCKSWWKSKFYNSGSKRKAYFDFQKSYLGQNGDKTVCPDTWPGKIFKKVWFTDVIEMPFEDTTLTIPRDYDAYLTLLYGDYMSPPPPDKRVSQHFHYFVDLDHRVSIEEAREIIKQNQK